MTARGYELDEGVRALKERVRRLELKEARNRPASGVSVEDPGGFFGGPGGLTIEQVLALIGAGTAPGAFLTVIGGGKGNVQELGNLGATETIDLANGNYFWGTLDQNCTISTTGWTNLKDCQITVELLQDGTGGWTPTFSGVTWIGGTPTWTTTAGTVTHVVLFSRDGGTTIYGAVVGGGSLSDTSLVTVAASGATETIDVSVARTYDVTLTANCTLTLTGAVTAEAWFVTLVLRQDGTGSRLATWPGSVVWPGGVTPTLSTAAASVDVFTLFTLDGGTVWFGFEAGGGGGLVVENEGTPLAGFAERMDFVGPLVTASGAGVEKTITVTGTLDDLTDVTLTTPALADRLRFDGSVWRNSALIWRPVTVFDPTTGNYLPLVDGSGNQIMAEA